MELPKVMVVMSRCSARGSVTFGIRLAEVGPHHWEATWAFPLPEQAASREQYDRQRAEGSIALGTEYPGCPGCGGTTIVLCSGCSKLGCADDAATTHRCPWCGRSGRIGGAITQLSGGADG